jgi:hypothetical protein
VAGIYNVHLKKHRNAPRTPWLLEVYIVSAEQQRIKCPADLEELRMR